MELQNIITSSSLKKIFQYRKNLTPIYGYQKSFVDKKYSYVRMTMKKMRPSDKRLNDFTEAAKKAGIKVTHQRLEIFRIVTECEDHPDVEQVYQKLKKLMPTVSLDTVYRNLWKLSELGLLKTVRKTKGTIRFDANLSKHHHFVCLFCDLIRDFNNEELNCISIPKEAEDFGQPISLQIEISGICEDCKKNKKRSKL